MNALAHQSAPRLLDAVEAVMDKHYGGAPKRRDGRAEMKKCVECEQTYPCPTVRAINTALEGK